MSIQADQYLDYILLEWWNTCDIGDILYQTGFQNKLYLEIDVGKPTYPIIEEGKEDGDKTFIPTFQRREKQYNFKIILYEYMMDAFSLIPLHDNIWITLQNGEKARIEDITIGEPVWNECGCTCEVDIDFTIDYVVKAACCQNMELVALDEGATAPEGGEEGTGETTPGGGTPTIRIEPGIFLITVNTIGELRVAVKGTAGFQIQIDWDDGNVTTHNLTGASQLISHSYNSTGNFDIEMGKNINELTILGFSENAIDCDFRGMTLTDSFTSLERLTFPENVSSLFVYSEWTDKCINLDTITMKHIRLFDVESAPAVPFSAFTKLESVDFSENALNADSVDYILEMIDQNSVVTTGTLDLSGGFNPPGEENAAPTNGAITGYDGITAKANLIAKGWTVTTN